MVADHLQRCSPSVKLIAPVPRGAAATRGCSFPANADRTLTEMVAPPSGRKVHDSYWGRKWKGASSSVWRDGQLGTASQNSTTGIDLEDFPVLEEMAGPLRELFDHYRQFGENTMHEGLFSKQVVRFARQANLVDRHKLTTAKLDLIFQRCLHLPPGDGGFIMGKTEMNMEQFKEALVEMAVAKFPNSQGPDDALNRLLAEHVKPLLPMLPNPRADFVDSESPEETQSLLAEMDSDLRLIFKVYSGRGVDLEEKETSMWKPGMTSEQMREAEARRAEEKRERYSERAAGLEAMDIKELVMFCEEFGVTGSATHSNKASLVSNREVMRVARSVKSPELMDKEHGIKYEEFLAWLERLAIEAFKEESHGLDTHAARVANLLIYIDSSPKLAEIKLAAGFSHRTEFTLAHKIVPMKQENDKAAAGVTGAIGDLVNRVTTFVTEDNERRTEMERVFEYYCSFGEKAPRDRMKSQGLHKLCRDCDLYNLNYRTEHLDLVHIEAGDKKINPRLGFSQWSRALADIARRQSNLASSLAVVGESADEIFGACCCLIDQQVRPRAMKSVRMVKDLPLATHPAVEKVLNDMLPLLKRMFSHYCVKCLTTVREYRKTTDHPTDARLKKNKDLAVTAQTRPDADLMSFEEFIRLSNDFHLCQRVGSVFDLGIYFRTSAHTSPDKSHINFNEFLSLMVRCALDYVDLDEIEADPNDAAEGVLSFVSSFFRSHGISALHRSFGDTNPLKRNADPEAFRKWMQDIMAGTSELQPGGRPPLRNMNQPTELDTSVMAIKAIIPDWAYKLLNLPAFKEYVFEVFDGYCNGQNKMEASAFSQFCEDARVFGFTFEECHVEQIVNKTSQGRETMTSSEFLTALWLISTIKFGFEEKPSRALVRVLREHLIPLLRAGEYEEEEQGSVRDEGEEQRSPAGPSKLREVLDELQAGVGSLFRAYSIESYSDHSTRVMDLQGLKDFCSDHHICPGLLSVSELEHLAVIIKKRQSKDLDAPLELNRDLLVDWIGLCSQHCYRDQPDLTPPAKVHKLVSLIREHASPVVVGSWAQPKYVQAYGIALSSSGPRKVTSFSPEKAIKQLDGLASEVRQSLPISAHEATELSGQRDLLQSVFRYYCGHGAGRPVNKLAGAVLNKLYKDCQIYDKHMRYEHMDILFLEAAGGRKRNPKLTLDFEQFTVVLFKTANKKYPGRDALAAFKLLLEQCIVPFANRESSEHGGSLRDQVDVRMVLDANHQLLELLFAYYTDLDIDPSTSRDHLQDAVSMSFRELCGWAKDFGLIGTTYCEGISQVRMAKIFQSVCQTAGQSAETQISFEGFEELLARCAMQLLSTAFQGATVEERVASLISKLRSHRSMISIENWLGRTQTNRTLMYRTKSNGTQHLMSQANSTDKWVGPKVKSVHPITRRMTQRAQIAAGQTPEPISFNPDKASNPAMQCCLRGFYA